MRNLDMSTHGQATAIKFAPSEGRGTFTSNGVTFEAESGLAVGVTLSDAEKPSRLFDEATKPVRYTVGVSFG